MIKLEKKEQPERLKKNADGWTKVIMDKLDAGENPTVTELSRYRHPEIKAALVSETHGKCAYCESKLQHIHHGDVEHIFPKSLDRSKTFAWENLTLACEVCNQNKSDKDPHVEYIIDPYLVDPEHHLMFLGGLIFSTGTVEGTSTRALLQLHRPELVEMRNRQVDYIMKIYAQVCDTSLPVTVRRAIYHDLLNSETTPNAPYSSMAKCIVREMERVIDAEILG
jgi:uncharacterized protein (TIGR02646 family)